MKFAEITGWVEEHPTESIVIGAGGLIAILWLLGYFGSSSGTSNSGASSLASAYYAAEAQQAVVGGQIQVATIQAAAQTAQTADQANAATAIAATQATAATTINGQNASAATTIADTGNNDQLLATVSSNNAAIATTASNNAASVTMNQDQVNGSIFSNYINAIAAPELAKGILPDSVIAGAGGASLGLQTSGPTPGTPSWYATTGYSPAQIAKIFGG